MTIDAYEMGDASPTSWAPCRAASAENTETHLAECVRCRSAVADLSGVPALLALVDDEPSRTAAGRGHGLETCPAAPGTAGRTAGEGEPAPPAHRWMAVTAMAVAAVVPQPSGVRGPRPGVLDPTLVPRTTVTAMAMDPVGDSEFAASFTMTRRLGHQHRHDVHLFGGRPQRLGRWFGCGQAGHGGPSAATAATSSWGRGRRGRARRRRPAGARPCRSTDRGGPGCGGRYRRCSAATCL